MVEATFTPPRDRRVGLTVQGRYRILRRIGEGGMGAVYEAEHLLIRKRVAIKTLHPHLCSRETAVARFRREALAATAVQNQHVVEVTDMGQFEDDGALFIVLEYLDGRNLADEIEASGPMPLGRAARIACQVCDALEAVHARGIVHRDLKPENLFLVKRGDNSDYIKVLDFGISKLRNSLEDGPARLTDDGMILGTAHFMSPEQAHGDPNTDHRTDIYALGGILYHMLTGNLLFEAETAPALLMKVLHEPPPPIAQRRTDLPPEVAQAVDRCLRKKPEERFRNVAELREVLAAFRGVDFPATSRAFQTANGGLEGSIPGLSRRSVNAWVLGVAGLALVLFVALGTHYAQKPAAEVVSGVPQVAKAAPSPPSLVPAPVRVHISTDPLEARLWIDGQPVENPFTAQRAPSDEVHLIEARADGYRPARNSVRFNGETSLHVALEREQPALRSAIAKTTSSGSPVSVPTVEAEPVAPAVPEPAAPVSPPAPAAADEVLGKRQLKRIGI